MRHFNHAAAGILALMAAGISACEGGDPEATGSTNPPASQSEQPAPQAMPAPSGDQGTSDQDQPAQPN